MDTILLIALCVCVAYAVVAVAMFHGQRWLVYRMDRRRVAPEELALEGVRELHLDVPHGHRLIAWHAEPTRGRPTLLYFHGQAGNLARRAERVRRYRNAGLGVLMVAYRGFSGSTGRPSERANVHDALEAYDWLVAHGVKPSDIVLYGESLGTGVAVQVAAQRQVSGVVLDSPFSSLVELAAQRHPYLPVRRFMKDKYETTSHAARITAPVLVLHGEKDPIVPLAMAREVFHALAGAKRMVTFPEGRHLNHGRFGSHDVVLRFLKDRRWMSEGYSRIERMSTRRDRVVVPHAVPSAVPARV